VKSLQAYFAHETPARRWTVVLCLLLLSVSVVAQSHLHPDDVASAAKHCPICQVAHSSSTQFVSVAHVDVGLTATSFVVVEFESGHHSSFDLGWHFSRPPPAA
jgi:hypothetical protein